ncbi:MAG: pantoate--beta-alanine ligase, partial [Candidatus Cloacimonetes bacterium]|nr:pantoate--beta-alanine ligase [Candidatus Cloacimonadota bacterium]
TIVSIYVNPTQFGENEDLSTYPRDLDKDIALLEKAGVDTVFFPSDQLMYPEDFKTWVSVAELSTILCGKSRPNHFRGVTTIVIKLLNLIQPKRIYLGEKDFQQLVILRTMVKDLNVNTEVIGCPLIREKDGLALSSRNKYLSPQGRKKALCLYNSLMTAQDMFKKGFIDPNIVLAEMKEVIESAGGKIDYLAAVDPQSLQTVEILEQGVRILTAVFIEDTRLIDNLELTM